MLARIHKQKVNGLKRAAKRRILKRAFGDEIARQLEDLKPEIFQAQVWHFNADAWVHRFHDGALREEEK